MLFYPQVVLPGAAPAVLQKMQELQMSKSALKRLRKKQAMMEPLSSVTHDDDDDDDDAAAAATGPSSSSGDAPTQEEKGDCSEIEEEEEEEEEVDTLDTPLASIDTRSALQQLSQEGPTVEQQHPSGDIMMPVLASSGTASTHMSHQTPRAQVAAAVSVPEQVAALIRPPLNDGGEAASTATPLYSSQAVGPSLVQPSIIAMSPSYPHQPTLSSSVSSSSSTAQNQLFHLQLNSGGSSISTDNLLNLLIGKTEPSKPLIPLQLLDSRLQQTAAAVTPAFYGANGLQYQYHHPAQPQQLQFNTSLLSSQTARYNNTNSNSKNVTLAAADKMTVPPPPGMDRSLLPSPGPSLPSFSAEPPPGLSLTYFTPKMSGSSSATSAAAVSKFTFADYHPEPSAPSTSTAELKDPLLSLPVHVSTSKISSLSSLLSQSSLQGGAPPSMMDGYSSSSSSSSGRGSLQQQPRPTQSLQQSLQTTKSTLSDASSSSSGNYYKSKSGFSVRL
jgi:hypothetical protein